MEMQAMAKELNCFMVKLSGDEASEAVLGDVLKETGEAVMVALSPILRDPDGVISKRKTGAPE